MRKLGIILALVGLAFCASAAEVWEPAVGTGPETNTWRRLVVYGDQWSRWQLAGHGGAENKWRRAANLFVGDPAVSEMPHVNSDVYDADGDGNTNDGYVAYQWGQCTKTTRANKENGQGLRTDPQR